MKTHCQVCDVEEATSIMSWTDQAPVKICPGCIDKAKGFLAGAYYFLRPIPKPREVSKEERELFNKLKGGKFATASTLCMAEGGLISLVGIGTLSMTRAHGKLFFYKKEKTL